jgi:hypothetical protein
VKNGKKRKGINTRFSSERQPSNQSKRKPKGKTVIREKVGLKSWDDIQNFLLTKGADKFIKSVHALKGRQFVVAYLDALEYFKPKLARTEHVGDKGGPIKHEHSIDYENLSEEQLLVIASLPTKSSSGTSKA